MRTSLLFLNTYIVLHLLGVFFLCLGGFTGAFGFVVFGEVLWVWFLFGLFLTIMCQKTFVLQLTTTVSPLLVWVFSPNSPSSFFASEQTGRGREHKRRRA